MIRFVDGEAQKVGETYKKMDCMIGEIIDAVLNNIHADDHQTMQDILVNRWEKMNIPMYCLGFAFNPFYYDSKYLSSEAPNGVARRAPNCDVEVMQQVIDAFNKIGEDEIQRSLMRQQLAKFQGKEGIFRTTYAKVDVVLMSPIPWWSTYGSETPQLAEMALKVLS